MNIYQAIMKAADHIEANSSLYDFSCGGLPTCGSPACMLGWIGFYLEMPEDTVNGEVSMALGLGHRTGIFYERIRILSDYNYIISARVAAKGMRLYAEKYHGHENPQHRPTSALVSDLMASVMAERIPEGMLESPEYAHDRG